MSHGQSQRSSFPGMFHIYLDRVVLTIVLPGKSQEITLDSDSP